MENKLKELGAVSLAGTVTYQLWEHDEHYVKLRHTQHVEQYIYIDKGSLRSLASIFTSAAKTLKADEFGILGKLPEPRL
jgi:hypothetical protein